MVKNLSNLPANVGDVREADLIPGSGRFTWSRKWQPTPVFLPGKFHGQRRVAGQSPWGGKESDTTEHTHTPVGLKSGKIFVQGKCVHTFKLRNFLFFVI